MHNAERMRQKLASGQVCLGTSISFADPTVTELLCDEFDFVWIDMEHNALSLESAQAHVMAVRGSQAAALVRVPWNEPGLIKPILDLGADGVVVPFVRSAAEVRQAVAACRYPPEGVRGYGPRRASRYGRLGGADYCQRANDAVLAVVQIEHVDAVNALDEILAVPGLGAIIIGPYDLSGSLGRMGQVSHPEVVAVIESIVDRARRAGVWVGLGSGEPPETLRRWIERGVQWLVVDSDYALLLRAARQLADALRAPRPAPA